MPKINASFINLIISVLLKAGSTDWKLPSEAKVACLPKAARMKNL